MRRFLILVTLLALTGCVAPMPPGDSRATEAAMAAEILATLTAPTPESTSATGIPPAGSPAPPPTLARPSAPTCSVSVEGLRLRSGPGTAYEPPLANLQAGTLLIPMAYTPAGDPDGAWIQVRLAEGAGVGWVAAGSVTCNLDPATLPVMPLPSKVTATATPTGRPKPPQATFTPTTSPPAPPPPTATLTASPTASLTPTATASPYPPPPQVSLPDAYPNGMAVDPESGNVFVTGRDTNLVYVLDRSLKVVKRIPVGTQPFGVLFMDGYVHVANFGSGSVTVIDARTLETISNPPGRGPAPESASIQNEVSAPTFIAGDPPRGRVVVALNGPQEVYRRYAYMYGVTPEGGLGSWGSVNGLPGGAYGIATLPSRARAYVSHRDASALMAVDTARAELVEGESLRGLTFVPYLVAALEATKTVYVTHNAPGQPAGAPQQISQFLALPGQALKLQKTVTVGELGPGGGALAIYPWREDMWRPGSPYDGSVWVGTRNKITVFDPTLVEQGSFGPADGIVGQPSAIAVDPVLRRVYVAEGDTGRIVMLSGW